MHDKIKRIITILTLCCNEVENVEKITGAINKVGLVPRLKDKQIVY